MKMWLSYRNCYITAHIGQERQVIDAGWCRDPISQLGSADAQSALFTLSTSAIYCSISQSSLLPLWTLLQQSSTSSSRHSVVLDMLNQHPRSLAYQKQLFFCFNHSAIHFANPIPQLLFSLEPGLAACTRSCVWCAVGHRAGHVKIIQAVRRRPDIRVSLSWPCCREFRGSRWFWYSDVNIAVLRATLCSSLEALLSQEVAFRARSCFLHLWSEVF